MPTFGGARPNSADPILGSKPLNYGAGTLDVTKGETIRGPLPRKTLYGLPALSKLFPRTAKLVAQLAARFTWSPINLEARQQAALAKLETVSKASRQARNLYKALQQTQSDHIRNRHLGEMSLALRLQQLQQMSRHS